MKYKVWDKVKINKTELMKTWDGWEALYEEWVFVVKRAHDSDTYPYSVKDTNYKEEELIPFLTYDL